MDFKRLRSFQEVAAAGSLSHASDRLRLAQPALSRHISLLEQEIGVPLFTRHGRGMQLTEAGAALLARIEGPLRQLERAAAEVRTLSGVVSGHVAVGMMPTAATALGGDLVQQMAERIPDVALRIVEAYDGYLMNWCRAATSMHPALWPCGRTSTCVCDRCSRRNYGLCSALAPWRNPR